jgi:DMSO/TMAO reductase YedYZ molybdopterin-dependent catalytic subunit
VSARGTDWGLAALLASLIATGVLTLFAGGEGAGWVYAVHDATAVAIAALLVFKLRRVWPRLTAPHQWDARYGAGVAATALVAAALLSGALWAAGVTPSPAGYSLLAWHDALGALLVMIVAAHMVIRAKRVRRRDLTGRRQFLAAGGIAAASVLAWRLERPFERLAGLRGARRRFTGSYESGSFAGNAFPSTSWVADNPRPIVPAAYRLRVSGQVARPLTLALAELGAADEVTATLDCTGGFYSTQRWRGVRLGRLIDRAGPGPGAGHVSVISRTGYRWSFGLDDARELLLATAVGGEPLAHEHGAPVRLVVPTARGYQWVKWVERIELRDTPDYAAPASTVWSSFTAAGSGG